MPAMGFCQGDRMSCPVNRALLISDQAAQDQVTRFARARMILHSPSNNRPPIAAYNRPIHLANRVDNDTERRELPAFSR